jgi:hypothetical protein
MIEKENVTLAETVTTEESPLNTLLDKPIQAERPPIPEGYRLVEVGEYTVRVNRDYLNYGEGEPVYLIDDRGREVGYWDIQVVGECNFMVEAPDGDGCGFRGSCRLRISKNARVAVLD